MTDKKSSDPIERTTMTIIGAVIGVVMLCSFALPTIVGSAGLGAITGDAFAQYRPIVSMVGLVLVVGLIIPIVRGYNSGKR